MHEKSIDEYFLEICRAFNKHGVKYVVIGAFAVIIQGYGRTTGDIDFLVDSDPENVENIKKALYEVFCDDYVKDIASTDIKEYQVVRYGTPANFYIDLLNRIGEVVSFEDVYAIADIFEFDDLQIPISNVDMLIKMKDTIRLKDKVDLEFLKEKKKKGNL